MVSNASEDLPEPDSPREHDQLVTRKVERDVLEVVLAGAVDDESIGTHGGHLSGGKREGLAVKGPWGRLVCHAIPLDQ